MDELATGEDLARPVKMSEKALEDNGINVAGSHGSPTQPGPIPDQQQTHPAKHDDIVHNAARATENEHRMSLWQGIRLYPKAVGWSLLISTCIAMEGYDVCLLSNFCKMRNCCQFTPSGANPDRQMLSLNSEGNMANNFRMVPTKSPHPGNQV